MTYTTPGRDRPTVLLSAAWIAYHEQAVDTIKQVDLDDAYRAARDLAAALGTERYRRTAFPHPGPTVVADGAIVPARQPDAEQVIALSAVIAAACGAAYGNGRPPSVISIADAVLAAGYHRDEEE
jgi:hypothetical protein